MKTRTLLSLAATAALAACGSDDSPVDTTDTSADTGIADTSGSDGGMMDDGGMDDAGMDDGGMMEDSGPHDAGMLDTGGTDTTMEDAAEDTAEDTGAAETTMLALQFQNLEPLGADFVYEGWLIVDGAPVTTGRFDSAAGGQFEVNAAQAAAASTFVLTIEPATGDAPEPSDVHVLGGDFVDGASGLSVAHGAALGTDFAGAMGGFMLQTPSSADPDDYANGIWFLDPTAGPGPALDLPELPAGWQYEGWVVGADGPVSTGTFTMPTGADSDAGGPAAGPMDTPPFPGQDFVDPAMSVVGTTVVISVEPIPDDSAAPFAIKPLVGMASDVGPGVVMPLGQHIDGLPQGSAWFFDPAESAQLSVGLENLEPLGNGYVYEGWLIVDGAPVTTGRFNAPNGGEFIVSADDAEAATAFVLTIEPATGDAPEPSDVHVLGGDVTDAGATLTIAHGAALGTGFADAVGTFILETPTSADPDDYANGIWYLDPSAGPGASLALPTLPAGWQYEGWVVGADGPISTGTFTDPNAADADGAGATAGTDNPGPPFPGQDFVTPPTALAGYTAVISVEPSPDDSPAPFALKPLVGAITDAGAGTSQPLGLNIDALPQGTVTFE